jgi:hypothetical protein
MRCRSWRKLNQAERRELYYLGMLYPATSGVRPSPRLERRGLVEAVLVRQLAEQVGENTWRRVDIYRVSITAKGLHVLATWERLRRERAEADALYLRQGVIGAAEIRKRLGK